MTREYEFTLQIRPHHGYGRFIHVDAVMSEPFEIIRYAASEQAYPVGIEFDRNLKPEVQYDVCRLSLDEFAHILEAWKALSKLTLTSIHQTAFIPAFGGTAYSLAVKDRGIQTQFDWHAISKDETPFDVVVQSLLAGESAIPKSPQRSGEPDDARESPS